MNIRSKIKKLLAITLFSIVLSVAAHDPFDGSTRMMVIDEDMEVTITLGADAARQIFRAAYCSEEQVDYFVRARGPHTLLDLPSSVTEHLLRIDSSGELCVPKSSTVLSDGQEIIFTLMYSRPSARSLEVRVVFYDEVSQMRQGSFVAYDDKGNQLGAALLSRASVKAEVLLPPQAPEQTAGRTNELTTTPAPEKATPVSVNRPSFGMFLKLGIEHILSGYDHLLFLMALLVGARKPSFILGIVTCFTIAHSVTLALAALNVVTISARIVEPLIAASIIVVCVENLLRPNATLDRIWLAGGFGLIHGFGFAGALRESGLAQTGAAMAGPLLAFNVGVEIGQLVVVAILLPLLLWMRRWRIYEQYGARAISTIVICVSSYWLFERAMFLK